MSAHTIALNRFGLGARVGEAEGLDEPRGWLLEQLNQAPPALAAPPPDASTANALFNEMRQPGAPRDPEMRRQARVAARAVTAAEIQNVLTTRITSDQPFSERWVAFWSNHLCVSYAGKARLATLAGAYERESIRPHVFGRFGDMLLASARHPAMLIYLDNVRSAGPNSLVVRRGLRPNRLGGLNENYARELLELHTVGVNGGYVQEDVEQLAAILTGWTIDRPGRFMDSADQPSGFRFINALHEPGDKMVLGVRYKEAGEDEGVRAIRDLARHPKTARFLATKIARHFIADDPPPSAIERLAERWLETEGDLRSVAAALVELDETWDEAHQKFRTPQDWLVAVLRAVGVQQVGPNLGLILRQLRHAVWAASAPTGYGDRTVDWADPDSLMNRAELARTATNRLLRDLQSIDPASIAEVVDVPSDDPLVGLLGDDSIRIRERLALAFAGPAFQWR